VEIVFLHRDGIEIGNVSIDGHEIIRQIHGDSNLLLVSPLLDTAGHFIRFHLKVPQEENASR
jgi:hypothetical protein